MKVESLGTQRLNITRTNEAAKADLMQEEISQNLSSPVNILSHPYRCIGLLKFTNAARGLTLNGTAFLIDCDLIVTSSDNIYNKQEECFYKDFIFYPPSFDKKASPIKIREFRLQESLLKKDSDSSSLAYSLALMKLDRPVICERYCQIKYDYCWQEGTISLFGYPKPLQERKLFGKQGNIIKVHQNILTHTIISEPGQAGSPIFTNLGQQSYIIGVQLGTSNHNGLGILITKEAMMKLCRWEREMMISKIKFSAFDKDSEDSKNQTYSFTFQVNSIHIEPTLVNWQPLRVQWEASLENIKRFELKGNKITRTHISFFDDRHKQVTTQPALPKEGKYVISFKIVKYGKNTPYDSIYIGLITSKHKKNEYSDGRSKGAIAYLCSPDNFSDSDTGKGTVLVDGIQAAYGQDLFINQGGELKMEINLINRELTWNNGRSKVAVKMASHYCNRAVHLFVSLCSDQSCVSWKSADDAVWS